MKIQKTASGSRKVTISKAEWLHIGKQAGWNFEQLPDNAYDKIALIGRTEDQILKNPPQYFEALFRQFKKERREGETDKRLLQLVENYLRQLFGNAWVRVDRNDANKEKMKKIKSEFSKWFSEKMQQFPKTEAWENETRMEGGVLHVPGLKI